MKTDFKSHYDKRFGNGTFNKLIEAKKKYSRDIYIRINNSRSSKEEVLKFFKKNRVKFSETFLEDCIKIEKSFFNLSSSIFALQGKIYLQDIASQVPVNCVNFTKYNSKVRVLDACASPGSKTTQICDKLESLGKEYELISLESNEIRINRLINNLQKMNFSNVKIINSKAQDYNSNDLFDVIFVDAPCSGNLVGDRDWLQKRDMKGILERSSEQKKILSNCIKLLKKDGVLVYSTCSIEKEENEENVEFIVKKLGLKSVKSGLNIPFNTKSNYNSIRFMPFESKTQGFFVSVFVKN